MDRSGNRKNKFAVWLTAIAVFFLVSIRVHSAETEALSRAMYHAKELERELEKANIKEREVMLRKAKFIHERLKEEIMGNPSNVKEYKQTK